MDLPYPVPFRFDRDASPRFRLVNVSDEPVRGVTLALNGPGLAPAMVAPILEPGASVTFPVLGDDLARSTALVIRWLRADGRDYLWRVSF